MIRPMSNAIPNNTEQFQTLLDLGANQAVVAIEEALARDGDRVLQDVVPLLAAHPETGAILDAISLSTMAVLAEKLLARLELDDSEKELGWDLLDVVRQREFLRRAAAAGLTAEWSQRIQHLIDASELTFCRLFQQRARRHPQRTLFVVPRGKQSREVTWSQVAGQVDQLARGLYAITARDTPGLTVAIFAHNCLEMALLDLACLSSGITNVMIPANASEADVAYILQHANVGTVVVAPELAERVLALREQAPALQRVIALSDSDPLAKGVLPMSAALKRSPEISTDELARRREAVRLSQRASSRCG